MSDAWLVIGIFAFAFILWVSTGGPTRPISFSGPYITPITDVDDTQEGYGDQIGNGERRSGLFSVRSIFGRFENSVGEEEAVGPVSAEVGKVKIVSGAGGPGGSTPAREYVVLRAESAADITGMRLVSSRSGVSVTIPAASPVPYGSAMTNVVLAEGEEAVVTTGTSPVGMSFRENKCVGYLGTDSFVPALSTRSCPSPTEELGYGYPGSASSYEECRKIVSRVPRCTVPGDIPDDASDECQAFMRSRLSYQGCVNTHGADADFRGDAWRIYLNERNELWRSDNETIRLLDRDGRTVDIYSY